MTSPWMPRIGVHMDKGIASGCRNSRRLHA